MKKEYISPNVALVELSTGDIMNISVNIVGGDIGENPDGFATFEEL